MATKIQLRRDTAANWAGTNPILAQGEPGIELDTNKLKVGDGSTAWNSLDYIAGSGNLETSTEHMFVKLNGMNDDLDPSWSGVISVSTDGLNWTQSTPNNAATDMEGWEVNGLAVGGGRIVYRTYNYPTERSELRWALNPFDKPNLPQGDSGDVSRRGPIGEDINWHNVRYVGNKFVAVGSYYDNDRDDYVYPYAAYSTDGNIWTRIDIDLSYANGLIQAERDANSNDVNGLEIQDVAYGNGGWLFALHWGPNDLTNGENNQAGCFYVTDLTTMLDGDTWVSGIPGAYVAKFDGHGWVTWSNYDVLTGNSSIVYINPNSDPRTGTWTPTDLDMITDSVENLYSSNITDVAAGPINGVNWIVVGTEYDGAIATNDQGATWRVVQTTPDDFKILYVSDTNPVAVTTWWGNNPLNGEKVTITGSKISQLNGTWYAQYRDGDAGFGIYLYQDAALTVPLNGTTWGDTNPGINDRQVYGRYGDHVLYDVDTTDLVVGMAAEGWSNLSSLEDSLYIYDPNTITAIDSVAGTVTMKYPWHGNDMGGQIIDFVPIAKRSRGDGIVSLAYGDGAFVGMGYDQGNRAYRTTDLVTWQHTSRAGETQGNSQPWGYNYVNSVDYGSVTTPAALLINNSETVPGVASFLNVGDTFNVNVTSGDAEWTNSWLAEGYGQGGINIDPSTGLWGIGSAVSEGEGFSPWSINQTAVYSFNTDGDNYFGNYMADSVGIQTWDYYFRFDNTIGAFEADNLDISNNDGMYIFSNGNELSLNGPWDGYGGSGTGYAALSWGDVVNQVKVNWNGIEIESEGYSWYFENDCNNDAWGVLYQPESALIQTPGYWKLGDVFYDWQNAYIQASNWAGPDPMDIVIHAGGIWDSTSTFAQYVFDRYGTMTFDYGDGIVQSRGFWAIGDYVNDDSYTYVGATDESAANAYDIEIVANNTRWYFLRTGNLQLPPGGDIVDSSGNSVLSELLDMPQTLVTTGDYTLVAGDRGKHIYNTGTGNVLIPTNAVVAFPIGTVITIISGDNAFRLQPVDDMVTTVKLSNTGTNSDIAIPADTYTTILKIATDKWIVERAG